MRYNSVRRGRLRGVGGVLVGVVAVLLLAECCARVVVAGTPEAVRWYDASAQLKVEQMDALGEVDVVFAGTSMAWQAFVPSVFSSATGETGYNAGLNGGTPEVMERWLLEEVEPRLQPRVVVWGLSSYDFAPAYGQQQRDVYDDALATRTGWLATLDQAVAAHSQLIANRTVLRSLNDVVGAGADQRQRDLDEAERVLGDDGERLDFDTAVSDELLAVTQARLAGFSIDGSDVDRVIATARELQRRGAEVVFVELPVPGRFIAAHPAGAIDHESVGDAINLIASIVDSRFVDLSQGPTDPDFVDYTHLTRAGSIRFTELFAEAYESGRDDRGETRDIGATTPAVDGRDCVERTVIDEYGFEVQILDCGDDDSTADPVIGDETAENEALVKRLQDVFLRRTCTEPVDSVDVPTWSADRAAALTDALEALRASVTACGTDDYSAALSRVADALERAALIDRTPADPASTSEATSRLVVAIDIVRDELTPQPSESASWAWYHSDEMAARFSIMGLAAVGDDPQTVAIGSSIAQQAFDQGILDAALDGGFLNVAMASADAEELQVLVPRLFADQPFPARVLWGLTTHRLLDPAGTDCTELLNGAAFRSVEYSAHLFPDLQGDISRWEMLIGPDPATSPVRITEAFALAEERFVRPGDRSSFAGRFEGIPAVEGRYPDPTYCEEREAVMVDLITTLQQLGAEVVLVKLPLHRDVVEAAPVLHATAADGLRRVAERTGVEMLDIAWYYDDAETTDGWHPTESGRDRLATEIAELLDELS